MILEKAYAKKYGSFSAVEGGLTHLALAELTNGIPEALSLEDGANTERLWTTLY